MPDYSPTGSGCKHNGEVWSSQGCYHIWYPWLLESRVLLMYMRLLPLGLSSGAPPGLRERLLTLVSLLCERGESLEVGEPWGAGETWGAVQPLVLPVGPLVGPLTRDVSVRAVTRPLALRHFTALATGLLLHGKELGAEAGALRLAGACRPPRHADEQRPHSHPQPANPQLAELLPSSPLPPPVALVVRIVQCCLAALGGTHGDMPTAALDGTRGDMRCGMGDDKGDLWRVPVGAGTAGSEVAMEATPRQLRDALRGRELTTALLAVRAAEPWLTTAWASVLLDIGRWDELMLGLIAAGRRRRPMPPGAAVQPHAALSKDGNLRPPPPDERLVRAAARSLLRLLTARRGAVAGGADGAATADGGATVDCGLTADGATGGTAVTQRLVNVKKTQRLARAVGALAALVTNEEERMLDAHVWTAVLDALSPLACEWWKRRELVGQNGEERGEGRGEEQGGGRGKKGSPEDPAVEGSPEDPAAVEARLARALACSAAHPEAAVRLAGAKGFSELLGFGSPQGASGVAFVLAHGLESSLSALLVDLDERTALAALHAAHALSAHAEGRVALSRHRPQWFGELQRMQTEMAEPYEGPRAPCQVAENEAIERGERLFFGPERLFRHECD